MDSQDSAGNLGLLYSARHSSLLPMRNFPCAFSSFTSPSNIVKVVDPFYSTRTRNSVPCGVPVTLGVRRPSFIGTPRLCR